MAAPKGYSVRTLKDFIGHDFGASAPIKVDQIRINNFADVTGDHQWIHVDVEKARKHSPFGGPVAHGFLTLSLVAAATQTSGVIPADAQGAINYGLESVRFLAPVPADASVSARFKLKSVEDRGDKRQLIRIEAQVEVVGQDKPVLVGKFLAMVFG